MNPLKYPEADPKEPRPDAAEVEQPFVPFNSQKTSRDGFRLSPLLISDNLEGDYFKCKGCGEKYLEEFSSEEDTAYCKWCMGEEK